MENKCGCWSVLRRNVRDSKPSVNIISAGLVSDDSQPTESTPPRQMLQFIFKELTSATVDFNSDGILGASSLGSVYKGWIEENGTAPAKPGTGIAVAVKRFDLDGFQEHSEWVAEVDFRGQHHPNLVELVGYCNEDRKELLVYKFMDRKSLEDQLFPHMFDKTVPLSWSIRMKIALGAAKGLAFLHDSQVPVIYRDFKTSRILLDSEFNAKLFDFSLAKPEHPWYESYVTITKYVGTYGYAAPEYELAGHFSSKSDVYSFGVVLLVILTGRGPMNYKCPSGQELVTWARPYITDDQKVIEIVDPRLELNYSIKAVQEVSQLAFQCLNQSPKCRSPMDEVVKVLTLVQNLN